MRDLYVLSNLVASTWQKRQATAHVKLIFASVNLERIRFGDEHPWKQQTIYSLHKGLKGIAAEILLTNQDFIELDPTPALMGIPGQKGMIACPLVWFSLIGFWSLNLKFIC